MDFFAIIFFLGLYYIRPQEWFAEFNALRPVQLLSVLALWGLIQADGLKLRNLVRTPVDFLVSCYFVWTLICGFQPLKTLGGIEAVLLFYFVAAYSLGSIPRQKRFLGWWCFFMFIIAALAVATQFGFDPLNSGQLIAGVMKGRLVLNLSVFDNPNALGHSIIPIIPLIYYLFFWRTTAAKAGLLLLGVPLSCIYLTQSKGAFLCAFATILATLTFGRSKIQQVILIIFAVGVGYGALYQLPRMNELNHAQSDAAIQGRVAAFTYGLSLMRNNLFGIGLGNFEASFLRSGPLEKVRVVRVNTSNKVTYMHDTYVSRHYSKATHCAYNQNGAELGYLGLYLFIGILYCCIRTLLLVKSKNDDEERIRRALFAMVVAYACSSWMVDFCYRPTFFMMVAAVSAFHRHLLRKQEEGASPGPGQPLIPAIPWMRRINPLALPGSSLPGLAAPATTVASLPSPVTTVTLEPTPMQPTATRFANSSGGQVRAVTQRASLEETLRKKFIWTRLGIMDYLIILALTYAAILYWQHLIATM